MADLTQIELPDGNTYDIKDANATDTKVTQTQDNSTNDNFEILLAGSTSISTATEEAKKTSSLVFNPSQQAITIGSRKSGSTIGLTSFASGYNVEASKTCSHAEGYSTKASGPSAHSEGSDTTASGTYSHAEGAGTTASGAQSHAEGTNTTASSQSAHAEGLSTTASGSYSHTEGYYTTASGDQSHAEGSSTTASGNQSHAEGGGTKADGSCAHAEGGGTKATGNQSHAEGIYTEASGVYAHAEGNSTTASEDCSHAEGDSTEASGYCAHAEGHHTTASSSCTHAEGANTTASGGCSHAEGDGTEASGTYSHAEGYYTTASNYLSHAEGSNATASGIGAHTEGNYTEASGSFSHVEGNYTISNHFSQHVFGEYNVEDDSIATSDKRGNYVEIVGNGTKTNDVVTRSNARTLDWNGNEVLSGKLTVGAAPTNNMDVTTKLYVDTELGSKQDTLTAGTGINIDANNVISTTGGGTITDVQVDGTSVVTSGVAEIDLTPYAKTADLATVATSGDYDDLTNKPTIPDISGKVDKAGDTMTGTLTTKNGRVSWVKGRDGAGIKNVAYDDSGSWYPVSSVKSKDGSWEYGTLSGSNSLYFSYAADSNYSASSNKVNRFKLLPIDTNDHEYTIAHSGNVETGDSNGQVKIAGTNVSVKGLGNAAYIGTPVSIANGGTGKTTAADARSALSTPAMATETYAALLPTNGSNNWIKIGTANTSYGILPSQQGAAGSGHNYIGTSSWYWKYAYIDEVHASSLIAGSGSFSNTVSLAANKSINLAGGDLNLNTSSSSSNDTGDIIWWYGNGKEKARLWMSSATYSTAVGPAFRVYNTSGTNLYNGALTLSHQVTLATWGNYNTVGQTINLSQSIQNFRVIIVQFGVQTDQSTGAGVYYEWIPRALIPVGASVDSFGMTYYIHNSRMSISYRFTSNTQIKIVFTNNNGSGGTAVPNGIRCVYGLFT